MVWACTASWRKLGDRGFGYRWVGGRWDDGCNKNLVVLTLNEPCLTYNWLVVWNMAFMFPFSWEFHNPNWRTHIFLEGLKPPTSITNWWWVSVGWNIYIYMYLPWIYLQLRRSVYEPREKTGGLFPVQLVPMQLDRQWLDDELLHNTLPLCHYLSLDLWKYPGYCPSAGFGSWAFTI